MTRPSDDGPQGPTVKDRWWVETGDKRREPARPGGPAGTSVYRSAIGFDQETARSRLTDLNMKLLVEANPPEGGWGYVRLADATFPERKLERLKQRIALPAYARGVVVDCGKTIRLLITGTPIGERVLDLSLGYAPSFDCWIADDWVRERVFRSSDEAIDALPALIEELLSPQGIARWESLRAQA
jgi:hypothetical protein